MGMTIDANLYLELLTARPPRTIETAADYAYWAEWIENIDFSSRATNEERELANLMTIALNDYDRKKHPELDAADPLGTLLFLLESNTMSQADLARLLGMSRTMASQICGGTRGISKAVALKLAERFNLPLSAFVA